jgi:hypothetical protein
MAQLSHLSGKKEMGIIPPFKRVDGNEYIGGTAREPAVGAKQVSEADGKSSRSVELKLVH